MEEWTGGEACPNEGSGELTAKIQLLRLFSPTTAALLCRVFLAVGVSTLLTKNIDLKVQENTSSKTYKGLPVCRLCKCRKDNTL